VLVLVAVVIVVLIVVARTAVVVMTAVVMMIVVVISVCKCLAGNSYSYPYALLQLWQPNYQGLLFLFLNISQN
jgi:hypothetical protein